jgi:RNA polymerase sigma-70 factor (ECF subfamily)
VKGLKKEPDERHLVEAAQRDPRRFAALYEGNFERVYAFIVRRVHDRDLADDLTSEVFHRALANIRRFEWRGAPFAAWLLRIAHNAIADRWKRASQERVNPPRDAIKEESSEEIERRATLFRLVGSLPADQRRVIVDRFVERKSIREIGEEMRRTEGAVKQLQFRALQNLRARMGEGNG